MTGAPDDLLAPIDAIMAQHENALANFRARDEAIAARVAMQKAEAGNVIRLADHRPRTLRDVIAAATIFSTGG